MWNSLRDRQNRILLTVYQLFVIYYISSPTKSGVSQKAGRICPQENSSNPPFSLNLFTGCVRDPADVRLNEM